MALAGVKRPGVERPHVDITQQSNGSYGGGRVVGEDDNEDDDLRINCKIANLITYQTILSLFESLLRSLTKI